MFWIWILATLSAFFLKGLCGFANTMVFDSILGFAVNNVNISPIELILGFPTNIILAWQNRKKLDYKVWVPIVILILMGSIPGALLLKEVNAKGLKIFFGIMVVLVGIEMLLREISSFKMKDNKYLMAIVGILAGLMCGLFGVGILLAAYVSRVTDTTDEFKANMSLVFIVENIFRIISYSLVGIITLESLKMTACLFPFMLVGLFSGIYSSRILDDKLVKKIVILLLIISVIVLVIKNI